MACGCPVDALCDMKEQIDFRMNGTNLILIESFGFITHEIREADPPTTHHPTKIPSLNFFIELPKLWVDP